MLKTLIHKLSSVIRSTETVAIATDGNQISLLMSQPPDLLCCYLRSRNVGDVIIAATNTDLHGRDPPIVTFTELEMGQGGSTEVWSCREKCFCLVWIEKERRGFAELKKERRGGREKVWSRGYFDIFNLNF